jgi:hypothetical protein
MPRFNPFNPKKPKRNQQSEFIDSSQDFNDREGVYNENRRSFSAFTKMFSRQHKNDAMSPEIILEKLDPIWEDSIEPVLMKEFGRGSTLYVIFYRGRKSDRIIMEIWDPNYLDVKASQVFHIDGVPESATRYFPTNRSQAEIGILADYWD